MTEKSFADTNILVYSLSLEREKRNIADTCLRQAECVTLWSEDMQHGFVVQDRLTIRNTFIDHV